MVDHKNIVVSKKLVAINSISSLLAKFVNVTVLLWMYQYLLNRISAEEFAVLPVVTSIMVFAPLFFSFFTGGISRYVVEAYAKGDFVRVSVIISSIFPLLVAIGLFFWGLGTTFAFNIDRLLNITPGMVGSAKMMMWLLVTSFTFQMMAAPFLSGFHVRQRFVELNLLGIGRDVVRIVLLLIFLLSIGPQVLWVVVATTISETVYSVVTIWRSRILVPELRLRLEDFSWPQARELTGFGLWTTLGRLGTVMYANAATILLNLHGSAADVTNYHLGATFFRQIDSTVGLAAQPLQPALTAMYALDDRRRLGETVLRGGRYALWVTMAVAAPLAIFSDTFIDLYLGGAYTQASLVIVFFMIVFPFTSPTALLPMTCMAMAQVRAFFLAAFLFQLAGLLLMIFVVARTEAGAIGMAISISAITILSQLSYFWPLCLKVTDLRWRDYALRTLLPGFLPSLFSVVFWLVLKLFVRPDTWLELLLVTGGGGFLYVLVLLGMCLDKNEKSELGLIFSRIRQPFRKV